MGNLVDYCEWRGDLSFSASPCGDVDCLLFAWLSYYPFEKLACTEGMTLREVYETHMRKEGSVCALNGITVMDPPKAAEHMLGIAAKTRRFGGVRVMNFRHCLSHENTVQFAAITFDAGNGVRYIAYRGTDKSVAGWKEDCCLSFLDTVPAQRLADEYLKATLQTCTERVVLCGHSKGGNLAVYASLQHVYEYGGRILRVCNFDGPGFAFDMLNDPRYLLLKERIETIVPASSIVGMLLEHEEDYRIVESRMPSIMQHDAMFWKIRGNDFIYTDRRSESSQFIDETLRTWIRGMSREERRVFTEAIFYAFEKAGVTDLRDLNEGKLRIVFKMLAGITDLPADTRNRAIRLLLELLRIGNGNLFDSIRESGFVTEITQKLTNGADVISDLFTNGKEKLISLLGAGKRTKDEMPHTKNDNC